MKIQQSLFEINDDDNDVNDDDDNDVDKKSLLLNDFLQQVDFVDGRQASNNFLSKTIVASRRLSRVLHRDVEHQRVPCGRDALGDDR